MGTCYLCNDTSEKEAKRWNRRKFPLSPAHDRWLSTVAIRPEQAFSYAIRT